MDEEFIKEQSELCAENCRLGALALLEVQEALQNGNLVVAKEMLRKIVEGTQQNEVAVSGLLILLEAQS